MTGFELYNAYRSFAAARRELAKRTERLAWAAYEVRIAALRLQRVAKDLLEATSESRVMFRAVLTVFAAAEWTSKLLAIEDEVTKLKWDHGNLRHIFESTVLFKHRRKR